MPQASRLRLVALVHMPLGHGSRDAGVRTRERAVLSAAASVITTSAWTRRMLLGLYSLPGDRVHVAAPGRRRGLIAPGTATGGSLLCVAAVIPGKGHDVLLRCARDDDGPSLEVSLRRQPGARPRVRRDTPAPGPRGRARDRVRFSGRALASDLERSYASADLLVLPSRAETYGMVVTEALARGLPVVAADVGGVSEALGRGADGSPARDRSSLPTTRLRSPTRSERWLE